MKNASFLTVLVVFVVAVFSGCATMPQTWPDYRKACRKQDGCNPGEGWRWAEDRRTLTLIETQMFLTALKGIRTDYDGAERQKCLPGRTGTGLMEDLMRLERRSTERWRGGLQESRSQGMGTGLSHSKGELMREEPAGVCLRRRGEDFQSRLDSIRREYLRMTGGGRSTTSRGASRHFPQARCIGNGYKSVPIEFSNGSWNEVQGKLKQKYGLLTDNDLIYTEGRHDELRGRLQKKLGKARDDVIKIIAEM